MSSAVIIGGGEFPRKEYPRELIRRADVIVCCDGNALKAFLRSRRSIFGDDSREPDAVVGDMDSMSCGLAREYARVMVKVDEQDDNDLTKAFHHVMDHWPEVEDIHLIACTGKREDHTIGNLGLLMEYARRGEGPAIDMVSDYSTAFAVTDNCELFLGKGRRVSIFSPDNTLKIKSKGLEWQTADVVFDNWWPATLNSSTEDVVELVFSHRSVALIITD